MSLLRAEVAGSQLRVPAMCCFPLLAHREVGLMTGLIPHMYAASENERECFFANHKYAVCTLRPVTFSSEDGMWLEFNALRLGL